MANLVWICDYPGRAKYKVYFVNYESQERNAAILKNCKLAKSEGQADIKVYIVQYEGQADIKIMRKNFPTG